VNIAITSNTSWNIYNFRIGLIQHLQSIGHTVFFVSPYDEYAILVTQKTKATHLELFKLKRKGKNPIQDRGLYKELCNIYKENKIELALHYTIKPNIYGALACDKIGIKCISNVTGLGFVFLKKSISNNIIKQFFKYALNKSNSIVLQNNEDKILMLEQKVFPECKMKLIYGSGINTTYFNNNNGKDKERQNDEFIFLFIGRLLYDKGIRELFQAFKTLSSKYSNLKLHIIGEIDDDNPSAVKHHELESLITESTNIVYFGKRNDVRQNISDSDTVVLPSYREGLPKSLLEAMSMSKPIITTNVPGCSQLIINNANGLLCEVKSSADLMDKMERMYLFKNEERIAMGELSRKLVLENYDEKIIVKQYQELILTLIP
jgi:glycosyltransferase involved in cell wall biosynthesis